MPNRFSKPEAIPRRITTREFNEETDNRHQLQSLVQQFNSKVLPDILRVNLVDDANRGYAVLIGEIELKTWASARRINIHLAKGKSRLSLTCAEKENEVCAILGMKATYDEMFAMLREVIDVWHDAKEYYLPDPAYGILAQ